MIKQVLQIILNEKKNYILLFVELLIICTCGWYILDMAYVTLRSALWPLSYDIEHSYYVEIAKRESDSEGYIPPSAMTSTDGEDLLQMAQKIKNYAGVEAVSLSMQSKPYGATSYGGSMTFQLLYAPDSTSVNAQCFSVTPEFFNVFHITSPSGMSLPDALTQGSVILSSDAEAELQNGESLLRQTLEIGKNREPYRVSAICSPNRWTEFSEYIPSYYTLLSNETIAHTSWNTLSRIELCFRVRSEADHDGFREKMIQDLAQPLEIGNLYVLEIFPTALLRETMIHPEKSAINQNLIIGSFLLLNMLLGVVGTFWFRTRRRRSELGLRIALGSSRHHLQTLLYTEGLVLLFLAWIPTLLFSFLMGQFEMIDTAILAFTPGRWIICLIADFLLLAAMIALGIAFPAYKAAQTQPAEALQDE